LPVVRRTVQVDLVVARVRVDDVHRAAAVDGNPRISAPVRPRRVRVNTNGRLERLPEVLGPTEEDVTCPTRREVPPDEVAVPLFTAADQPAPPPRRLVDPMGQTPGPAPVRRAREVHTLPLRRTAGRATFVVEHRVKDAIPTRHHIVFV